MVGVTSAGVIDTAAYSCTSCTGILGKQESLEAAAACFPATPLLPPLRQPPLRLPLLLLLLSLLSTLLQLSRDVHP